MWTITVPLLLMAIGLWFRWRKKRFSTFQELGIPGPEPNIFIGNLGEMLKMTPVMCHEKWLQKYGKVVGYYFGGTPTLLVADTDLVKQILIKDFHKFPNRQQILGNSNQKKEEPFSAQLTTLRNKRWKEIRSIITPSFTTSKMKMMAPVMNGAVDSLINAIDRKTESGKSFDIYELYRRLTMDVIGRTAFGIQTDVQNNPDDIILKAAKIIFGSEFKNFFTIMALSFPEFFPLWKIIRTVRLFFKSRGRNPILDLVEHIKEIVHVRRTSEKNLRQDLLQIMMDAKISDSEMNSITNEDLTADDIGKEDQDKKSELMHIPGKNMLHLTDHEIVDNSLLFFLAGYETTSTALAFITHFLINYPEVQTDIRNEIHKVIGNEGKIDYNSVQQLKYMEQVMMESLRVYPPIYLFVTRMAEEDVEYAPYKIPKGMGIQIPVYNMNHDSDLWPSPSKFDPSRFSPENKANIDAMGFQTFGVGPRNCVGMRFAQLEIKLALAKLLNKYELIKTEESERDPIDLKISFATLTPAKGVTVKAVPLK